MRSSIAFRRRFIVFSLYGLALVLGPGVLAQNTTPDDFVPGSEHPGMLLVPESATITFSGQVQTPTGQPAEGAVVVTSAGGKAVTDANGTYHMEVRLPNGTDSVQVTAVGRTGQNAVASRQIPLVAGAGPVPVGSLQLSTAGNCSPHWLPTFGGEPGGNNYSHVVAAFDDGTGTALYAAGGFFTMGGVPARQIAKWDGTSWATLGTGLLDATGEVALPRAMAVFDDGGGPALYVGGLISIIGELPANNIVKWDGESWTAVPGGVNGGVNALTVFDDGSGAALYVGGTFDMAGGLPANRVAKWDGSNWTPLGTGISGPVGGFPVVHALTVFDDGAGDALYVGGGFTKAGQATAYSTAKWDGSQWHGQGVGLNDEVYTFGVFDDGSGAALHAGGRFTSSGATSVNHIAKWNGSNWLALAGGVGEMWRPVHSLAVFDDGSGEALYAGGTFSKSGGAVADGIAKWDGLSWTEVGGGLGNSASSGSVGTLAVFDDGTGESLFMGGAFTTAGQQLGVGHIAEWNGSNWARLGSGLDDNVTALAVFDDGGGATLVVAGAFQMADGISVDGLATWDGTNWTPFSSSPGQLASQISRLVVFDDGTGDALYASGYFLAQDGVTVSRVAKWDGTSWSHLPNQPTGGSSPHVGPMLVHDDGSGSALFVGGRFDTAGGAAANNIAKWNGTNWTALGGGVALQGGNGVWALTVFDGGGTDVLIVAGGFSIPGVPGANGVARWDGTSWTALGFGLNGIFTLAAFDDGGGAVLYAAHGVGVSILLSKWDGTNWVGFGSFLAEQYSTVQTRSLGVFDNALYVGGTFASVDGVAANGVARWDGSNWEGLGAGLYFGSVYSFAQYDDGLGEALYVGGSFRVALGSGDSYLAKWGCPGPVVVGSAYCFGDGSGSACPCGASGNAGEGCANSGGLGGATLTAAGVASMVYDSFTMQVSGVPGEKPGILLRGANQLNAGLGNAVGDGLLCTGGQVARSQVQLTVAGETVFDNFRGSAFGQSTYGVGVPTNYQFWYRDSANTCTGTGFNFSNAWTTTWLP